MNYTRYNELLEKEKRGSLTTLETEELDLLKKLQENSDKQIVEQAAIERKKLEDAAAAGDQVALQKLQDLELAKRDQKVRDEVNAGITAKQDKAAQDAKAKQEKTVNSIK